MNTSARNAFVGSIVAAVAFATPLSTAAQALTQTIQMLPPGGANCPVLLVHSIVAHVSDGALHSFDVTIGNPSYVGVFAQAGGQGIPFRYMTRFDHGGGMLRYHVDLDPAHISGAVPVSLTLLSSPPGSPTCLTVISFGVSPTGTVLAPAASTGAPTTPTGSSGSGTGQGTTGSKPSTPVKPPISATSSPVTPSATSSTTTVSVPAEGGIVATFRNLCEGNGAFQLWFLLLALYIVLAALTALAKPPLAQRSVALPLVLILVPLVFLLGFWYFAPTCRAGGWVPAVSIIVAIAALLAAFREQTPGVKIIPLPAAKPSSNTPMVTKTAPSNTSQQKQGKK